MLDYCTKGCGGKIYSVLGFSTVTTNVLEISQYISMNNTKKKYKFVDKKYIE